MGPLGGREGSPGGLWKIHSRSSSRRRVNLTTALPGGQKEQEASELQLSAFCVPSTKLSVFSHGDPAAGISGHSAQPQSGCSGSGVSAKVHTRSDTAWHLHPPSTTYLPAHPPTHLSTHPSVICYPPVHSSSHISIHQFIHQFIHLFIHQSNHSPTHPSVHQFIHPSHTHPPICLFIHPIH